VIDCPPRRAARARGDAHAQVAEPGAHACPALGGRSQQLVVADAHVVERELHMPVAVGAAKRALHVQPRCVTIDHHQRGRGRVLATRRKRDRHDEEIGLGAAGHVRLAAADAQRVAFALGDRRAQTVARLGDRERAALLACEQRQEIALAQGAGGGGEHTRLGTERVAREAQVRARERLDGDHALDHADARAARPARLQQTVDAGRSRALGDLLAKGGGHRGVVARGQIGLERRELAVGELANARAQGMLLGGQRLRHG
jgi:hypothetical protein